MKFPVRKSRFTDIVPVDAEIDVDEPNPRPDPLIIYPEDDPQRDPPDWTVTIVWAVCAFFCGIIWWNIIAAAIHYIGIGG